MTTAAAPRRSRRATPVAAHEIGAVLRSWRLASDLSIDDLAYAVRHAAPGLMSTTSRETVRRHEVGSFDLKRMNFDYLIVVARVFGHEPSELGERVAKAEEDMRAIAFTGPTGGGNRGSSESGHTLRKVLPLSVQPSTKGVSILSSAA